MLTFDKASHTYAFCGRPVPSVTQVLKAAKVIDDRWYTPESAKLGTAVHEATALYDRHRLRWDSLHPRVQPYVQAWANLRQAMREVLVFTQIEAPVCSPGFGYAGTADRIGYYLRQQCILDIKTGGKERWPFMQAAGYAMAEFPNTYNDAKLLIVYLRPNATFDVQIAADTAKECSAFYSALQLARHLGK